MRGRLDSIDLAILKELQKDGSITNVELARRVGLSAPRPACDGCTLLDPKLLGYEVVFFAMVQLAAQGKNELAGFQARVKDWPAVRECWTLSGDVDFILKCVASNLSGFQAVVTELTALPNVRNVRSALTLDVVKDEPLVPLETQPAG